MEKYSFIPKKLFTSELAETIRAKEEIVEVVTKHIQQIYRQDLEKNEIYIEFCRDIDGDIDKTLTESDCFKSEYRSQIRAYRYDEDLDEEPIDSIDIWYSFSGNPSGGSLLNVPNDELEELLKQWLDIDGWISEM